MTPPTGTGTAFPAPGDLVADDAAPVTVPVVCEPVGAEVGGAVEVRVDAAEAREARMALLAGAAA